MRALELTLTQEKTNNRVLAEHIVQEQDARIRERVELEKRILELTDTLKKMHQKLTHTQQEDQTAQLHSQQLVLSVDHLQKKTQDLEARLRAASDTLRARNQELDLARIQTERLSRLHEQLLGQIEAQRSSERLAADSMERIQHEVANLRLKLQQYQSQWHEVTAREHEAKRSMEDALRAQKENISRDAWISDLEIHNQKLQSDLAHEKQKCDELQEKLIREKKDKQLALTHLNAAETKMHSINETYQKRNFHAEGLHIDDSSLTVGNP